MASIPGGDYGAGVMESLTLPGMIVIVEACVVFYFIRSNGCAMDGFAEVCAIGSKAGIALLGHNPIMILLGSYVLFVLGYFLACLFSMVMNWLLCITVLYFYLTWWYPPEGLNDGNFWLPVFIGGLGGLLIFFDHLNIHLARQQRPMPENRGAAVS